LISIDKQTQRLINTAKNVFPGYILVKVLMGPYCKILPIKITWTDAQIILKQFDEKHLSS